MNNSRFMQILKTLILCVVSVISSNQSLKFKLQLNLRNAVNKQNNLNVMIIILTLSF